MFHAKVNSKASSADKLAARARDARTGAAQTAAAATQTAAAAAQAAAQSAAQTAAAAAQTAAQTAAAAAQTAAQTAAAGVSKGVRQGVFSARDWAAPRLEGAAEYTETTVAPKVSSALRSTARQVRPVKTRRRKIPSALTWSILGAAVLAGMGAAGALVWQRYRTAMAADTEEEGAGAAPAETASPASPAAAGPADSAATSPADSAATSTDTGVNGRVSAPGR